MRSFLIRGLAFVVGTAVLVYAVMQNVEHVGGWQSSRVGLPIVVGLIVWVCNIILSEVMHSRRWWFVAMIGCVLLLAEVVNQLATAERLHEVRADASAPYRQAEVVRKTAQSRLTRAEQALAASSTTSARLTAAETTKREADQAVLQKSSERGCADNCRLLLTQAVDKAAEEVKAARTALDTERQRLKDEVDQARSALSALKPTRNAPEVEPPILLGFTYSQYVSGLTSLLLNVGVSALLAFAVHPPKPITRAREAEVPQVVDSVPTHAAVKITAVASTPLQVSVSSPPRQRLAAPEPTAEDHAKRFVRECIKRRPGASTSFPDIHAAYKTWCARSNQTEHPLDKIVPAIFNAMVDKLGVTGQLVQDVPHANDIAVISLVSRAAS